LVVVALAVLLLPLWLDGGGLKTPEVQPIPATPIISQPADISIPAPSATQINELQNPPASALPTHEPESPATQPALPPKATENTQASTLQKAPEAKTQAAKPVDIKPAEAKSQSKPISAAPPTSIATPTQSTPLPAEPKKQTPHESNTETPIEKPTSTQASLPATNNEGEWVVQLGSFSDELNARGLAKSVSDSGFKVEVSPLFAKKGTVWRVRVGPYSTREQAVKTTTQLRERLGRDGLVMPK
jgi:DedD protein